MRALILQHDPGSRPGLVGAELTRHGFDLELLPMAGGIADGTWHGAFPGADDYDLVVSLGAIWSLYDRTQVGTWIDRELDLLRDADAQQVPVLGICFGGQALAAAHGARVEPSPRPEIGWTTIDSDDVALIPPGPWMQWHTDRFTVPRGATEVARNPIGPQAFRLRRNLGVQFHPEVDEANIRSWLHLGGDEATAAMMHAGTSAEEVLADARRHHERAATDVARLVAGFLTEVALDGEVEDPDGRHSV